MVNDINPNIMAEPFDNSESWANKDVTDAELGLESNAMFRKNRMG